MSYYDHYTYTRRCVTCFHLVNMYILSIQCSTICDRPFENQLHAQIHTIIPRVTQKNFRYYIKHKQVSHRRCAAAMVYSKLIQVYWVSCSGRDDAVNHGVKFVVTVRWPVWESAGSHITDHTVRVFCCDGQTGRDCVEGVQIIKKICHFHRSVCCIIFGV